MATITVSTTAQLTTALSAAHAGDTILLAAGTYSAVNLQNYNFTTPVTITSADATHPATLTGLMVRSSSGLNFTNLELDASHATADWPFAVYTSTDLNFSHLYVHGSLDSNPQNDFSGLIIRNSSNVSVSQSEFEQLKTAVAFLDDDHLQVSGSSFHDLALDGVHGGGSSYVTISGNSFTDFFVAVGDHPDAIQFWTTNTTASAHDILISDNVIVRGAGAPMQGIFITDQVGTLPYQNVTITDNMLVGTRYHGITVSHAEGVDVSSNIVAGLPDMLSWIRLENVNGAMVTNDIAGELTQVTDLNIAVDNFTAMLPTATQASGMLAQWLGAHSSVATVVDGTSVGILVGTSGSTTGTTSNTGTTSGTDTGTTTGSTTGSTTGTTSGTTSGDGSSTKTGPVKQPYSSHGKKAGLVSASALSSDNHLASDTTNAKTSHFDNSRFTSFDSDWMSPHHQGALVHGAVDALTWAEASPHQPGANVPVLASSSTHAYLAVLPVEANDHWLAPLSHALEHPLF